MASSMKSAVEDIRKSSSVSFSAKTLPNAHVKSRSADKARAINNYNNMLRKENGGYGVDVNAHHNDAFSEEIQPSLANDC